MSVVRIIYVDGWRSMDGIDRHSTMGVGKRVDGVSAECRQPIDRLAGDYRSTHELVNT